MIRTSQPMTGLASSSKYLAFSKSTPVLDKLSFIAILILFIALPFHSHITSTYGFYREILNLVFILFIILYQIKKPHNLLKDGYFIWCCLWIVYLLICYFFDPEISIYGENILQTTVRLSEYSPRMYVLRNLFLYLPLFWLIYLRGLRNNEFILLLTTILLLSPFSYIYFAVNKDIYSFSDYRQLLYSTGHGFSYNDYIPYFTFTFIIGLYLLFYFKKLFLRLLILALTIMSLLFIVSSTGRQSVLFCALAIAVYCYYLKRARLKKVFSVFALLLSIYYLVIIVFPETLINRYFSSAIIESGRYECIIDGIGRLASASDWMLGKGLSAVISSGPHNNYIRFVLRIGLIGMLLTYWPFFYIFKRIMFEISHFSNKRWFDLNMAIFSLLCISFTLFHSFFGYPHEDAFNAPYVWLGLAMGTICLKQINYRKSSRT